AVGCLVHTLPMSLVSDLRIYDYLPLWPIGLTKPKNLSYENYRTLVEQMEHLTEKIARLIGVTQGLSLAQGRYPRPNNEWPDNYAIHYAAEGQLCVSRIDIDTLPPEDKDRSIAAMRNVAETLSFSNNESMSRYEQGLEAGRDLEIPHKWLIPEDELASTVSREYKYY
ncbi:hypothetical protein KY320_02615, partial [Candidatus Woesearchaeota archaeon]|nr:hypothetical protein [Candidatus Woesearchaeota archaeon]